MGGVQLDLWCSAESLLSKTVPRTNKFCDEGAERDCHCHAPQGDDTKSSDEWPLSPGAPEVKRALTRIPKQWSLQEECDLSRGQQECDLREPEYDPVTCDCHMTMTYNHMTVTPTEKSEKLWKGGTTA